MSVAIVSGGIDSITLLHDLVKRLDVHPAVLTFIYGQKNAREIECARLHADLLGCHPHHVMDVSALKSLFATSALVDDAVAIPDSVDVQGDPQPSTYVPNRNMIFLALAVAYAESVGATDVYYGAQRQDSYSYWDTTPQFLGRLNHVYQLNPKTPVTIHAPFVHLSKADVLRRGLALEIDYGQTWSCYAGQDVACGRCPTCVERLAAFDAVGVADPLPYAEGS